MEREVRGGASDYQLRRSSSFLRESAPNFDESSALAPKTPRTVKRLIMLYMIDHTFPFL
jgi:hypothetical protein